MLGTTQRGWAYNTTDHNREEGKARSQERWKERWAILQSLKEPHRPAR